MARELRGVWLGRRAYGTVHTLQLELQAARQRSEVPDTVLLLEHEPVITLGRGGHRSHVLLSEPALTARGIELHEVGRGGDVTLHAPGQLVGYPILNLAPDRQDIRRYVGDLSWVMEEYLRPFGLSTGSVLELPGLWLDAAHPQRWEGPERAENMQKIGAIGVRVSRWVTMHGFALNLTTDLSLFSLIVPCGIQKHGVTSLLQMTGQSVEPRAAAPLVFDALCQRFNAGGKFMDASALSLSSLALELGVSGAALSDAAPEEQPLHQEI